MTVARSANPRTQRQRDAERQRLAAEQQQREFRRKQRRSRMLGVGVLVVVVAAVFGVVIAATGENAAKSASSSTSSSARQSPTTTAPAGNPNPPVSLPTPPAGAALTSPTTCPAVDGSAPRTTSFAGPPPMCIETTGVYNATISTTKGDIQISLDAATAPNSVNNFIVLARYHYYDGLPITRVVPRGWAEVGDPINADGREGPGYTVAGETQPQGSIATPVIVAMIPDATGASGGGFLFGIADQAPNMPPTATQIGMIMDSRIDQSPAGDVNRTVQQEINKIGTTSGAPAEVVTITSITVQPEPLRAN